MGDWFQIYISATDTHRITQTDIKVRSELNFKVPKVVKKRPKVKGERLRPQGEKPDGLNC